MACSVTGSTNECSICLQEFIHPVKLPCGHVFCFLCIKGCALHRKRCPMCRSRFSARFFDEPVVLNVCDKQQKEQAQLSAGTSGIEFVQSFNSLCCQAATLSLTNDSSTDQYSWYYEGFEGWWQYDERTCLELEANFKKVLSFCEITIAGYVYVIDFKTMTQMRKDRSGRKRRIKRDLITCEKKGIAGIKLGAFHSGDVLLNNLMKSTERQTTASNGAVDSNVYVSSTVQKLDVSNDNSLVKSDIVDETIVPCSSSTRTSQPCVLNNHSQPLASTSNSDSFRSVSTVPDSIHHSEDNSSDVTKRRASRSLSRSS